MMARLSARSRSEALARLAARTSPLDVLVVGGGVTGVGVALDAATRGLDVALVEASDLASGTSRWSSKLVHGGLRYLATGGLSVARESALERHHLMTTIAPHLIRPLRQVVPDHGGRRTGALIGAGFHAGDLLRRAAGTPTSVLPGPARLSPMETLGRVPAVRRSGLRGAVSGVDGQLVDDARLVVAIARTAAAYGAAICTYTRAEELTGTGATLTDTRSGERFRVRARAVVNATGVWAADLDQTLRLRPSRGTHLVFDAQTFGNPTAALTVPAAGSLSRFVFALPAQLGRVYVGLTDVDAPGPVPDVPLPADDEITYLLDGVSSVLQRPVTRDDVRGMFAGLRPLIDTGEPGAEGDAPADLSRRHRVQVSDATLISVVGGKLTTYRRMAQDALDTAVGLAGLSAGPCVTTTTALVGAIGDRASGLPASLVARYGAEASAVVDRAQVTGADEPIVPGIDVTRAEVEFAFSHEGALCVDDVIHRRTRIGLVDDDAKAAWGAVEEIAAEVG